MPLFPTVPPPIGNLASPTASDRILVVAPHPDDETIGAAGYIAEAERAGAQVRIIVATDGAHRGKRVVRHRELLSAVAKLGVQACDVSFFDFPDGYLNGARAFQPRLQAIFNDFRPTVVLGTHAQDFHPDHAAVGRAIERLGGTAGHPFTACFFVVHFHRYPAPDAFRPATAIPFPTNIRDSKSTWAEFDLTGEAESEKEAAVLEYHSQLLRKDPLRRGLLISFIRKDELFAVRHYPTPTASDAP